MRAATQAFFGARGQVFVGGFVFVVSVWFWVIGCFVIKGAVAWPWNWTQGVFIFHASMFALVLTAYAIVTAALAIRQGERVEAVVADNAEIEHADEVTVKT